MWMKYGLKRKRREPPTRTDPSLPIMKDLFVFGRHSIPAGLEVAVASVAVWFVLRFAASAESVVFWGWGRKFILNHQLEPAGDVVWATLIDSDHLLSVEVVMHLAVYFVGQRS